jgi:hypothetical protein
LPEAIDVTDQDPFVRWMERAAPWVLGGLIAVLVLTALLAGILGAPWMR